MSTKLERKYGLFTAICMVAGIVIGSGVFFKAQDILIKHMSVGSYTMGWYNSSVDLHEKWGKVLPIYIEQKTDEFKALVETKAVREWRARMGTYGIYEDCRSTSIARYVLTHPFNRRSYRMVKGWIKYKRRKQR